MSILLNSSAMRSLVNSLMLGNHSHHHHHKKENSFSSTEVMSTITESSNSSIDSGTFDVYDDPEDHFYDEPLLSNDFDYQFDDIDQQFKSIQLQQQQQQLSNSKPPGFSVDDDTSTVIKSFLLETVNKSVNQESSSLNNHKQLEVKSDFLNQNNLNSATTKQLTSITNNNSNIKKPRPPKPPRHIKNPSSSAKLINCEQTLVDTKSNDHEKRNLNNLQLTLPPKGVKLSSSSSISSGISSKSSSPIPLTPLSPKAKSPFLLTSSNQSIQSQQYQQEQVQQQSQPQLTKPSRKPVRPPPPVPDQPREEKKSSKVSSKQLIEEDLSTNKSTKPGPVKEVIIDCLKNNQIDNQISNDSSKAIESSSNMAVLNRSRSGQGSFYETAFDSSKVIIHGDSLHHHNNRDQMNHLNGNNNNNSHNNHHHPHHFNHHAHPNHNSSVSNQAQQQQIITTYRRGSETSVTSFTPEASSRSSTASSTTSSNGHESGYSTPKHLDQLPKALLPRRQGIKSTVHIPRSKSSDVTLNLTAAAPPTLPSSATASSSSSSSSPVNQLDVESKPPSSTAGEIKRNRSKMNSLSTFSMLKSATSDALSSLDCEAGRYLIRTRSNLDSLRMSLKERNNNYNRISSNDDNVLDSGRINGSIKTLNLSSASININNGSSANNNHTTLSTINSASNNNLTTNNNNNKKQSTEKKPATANRSFRRLELKLNEVRNSVSLSNAQQLQSPLNDTRPLDDYDTPWDSNQRLNKVFNKLINTPTSEKIGNEFLPVNSVKCKTPLVESNPISLVSGGGDACQQQTDQTANHQQQQEQSTISNHQQRKGSNGSTDSTSLVVAEGDNNNSQQQQHKSCSASPVDPVKVDNRLDKIRKLSLPLNLKNGSSNNQNNNSNGTNSSAPRANLNLDLSNSTVTTPTASDNSSQAIKFGLGSRKKPFLSFTGQPLPAVSEDIDTTLVLEKQGWYHGSITRLDAENLLRNMKEGSYLIRNCESTKQDYSLSLKSVKGFMHMKIVKQSDGKYILGVFSKPFSNIPEMVKHYSINKLPIRGAEHMSLLYPVIDQLL